MLKLVILNSTLMHLLIVESPAKSKTISKYLGGDYKVVASVGHIRDLPKSNKKAIDIEGGFIPHYEISKGKERVVEEIKSLAKKADEILLATDPDREGEAIAWHLSELIKNGIDKSKIKRVTYHEITKEAIEEALKHPRKIDENLKEAQEARRVLDRLVGYDLSGLIWKKVRYGLSAGRVQSPALRIIMEREREIRNFKPEDFWVITAKLSNKSSIDMLFICSEEPKTASEAERIVEKGKNGKWKIVDITETEVKRSPRPPFITSTLQQAASSRLGFSPSRTMIIAQKLYEAGHITYMRTDSTNLSQNAIDQIRNVVESKYGKDLFQLRLFSKKTKNAQEAHEAIRPTRLEKTNVGHTDEQKKLYNLIWSRTVASQMRDAVLIRTRIEANIEEKDIPNFASSGQRVIFEGWFKADPRARGEDIELPKIEKDENLELKNIESERKQTQPPNRYSEAGLVKELEKRGIGRPSTYASIIKTLIDREYVIKDNKALVPTDTGDVVSTFLENNFDYYISDNFTAEMEDKLDLIAEGKASYEKTLKDFYSPFLKEIKSKEKINKLTTLGEADKNYKCPICGNNMVIKLGRSGKFLSCEIFPECKGMRSIDGEEIKEAESIGKDPKTGLPIFIMDGRFGPYVQLGELNKEKKIKPKRASIPKDKDPNTVTIKEALQYLSLPRELGKHPETGEMISANIGRFGPYIVHQDDFRSLKSEGDDVYTIELERALEILKKPKKSRFAGRKKFL